MRDALPGAMRAMALGTVVFALGAGACFGGSDAGDSPGGNGGSSGTGGGAPPIGPVAENAEQAWPDKPDVTQITREQIANACALEVECALVDSPSTDALIATELCVSQITWSAERAIPMSNLLKLQERAEYRTQCVLDAGADCEAQKACSTGRDSAIHCEEDGCRITGGETFTVSCDGDVATLSNEDRSFSRDCARAFAKCSPESPTGCTDRLFSACPAAGSKADRCDGDIRLGCDGAGQVSYRDCTRMGGICGTTTSGAQDCIYTDSPDPACADESTLSATCESGVLSVCVTGERVSVASTLCAP